MNEQAARSHFYGFSAKPLLLAVLLACSLLASACQKRTRASAPPTRQPARPKPAAPTPERAPIPSSLPVPPPAPSLLEIADRYFEFSDYANAAQAYERYLHDGSGPEQDKALYRLALSHAVPQSPVRDLPKAWGLLQQLVSRFPQSPYKPQAEFLLGLQGEIDRLHSDISKRDDRIKELSQELEKLKAIDMQRRPSRTQP